MTTSRHPGCDPLQPVSSSQALTDILAFIAHRPESTSWTGARSARELERALILSLWPLVLGHEGFKGGLLPQTRVSHRLCTPCECRSGPVFRGHLEASQDLMGQDFVTSFSSLSPALIHFWVTAASGSRETLLLDFVHFDPSESGHRPPSLQG